MNLQVRVEEWPLRTAFRITGRTTTAVRLVLVELRDGDRVGRGEACGVYYHGETAETLLAQIRACASRVEQGIDRKELQALLPAGGARNALDCALWELEARRAGVHASELAGIRCRPLLTTYTIGADEPQTMAARAREFAEARNLKLKLVGDGEDAARVRAVSQARPDVRLAVDANQGLTRQSFRELLPSLIDANVYLLEQPFAIGKEADMDGLDSPIPVAADESARVIEDLSALVGRFQVVNIKLDKAGGLTHALEMARAARALGFKVMVGNMIGTSWSHAPAYILGQLCDYIDLDGPLLLSSDRSIAVEYHDGYVHCDPSVWGSPA